VNKNLFVSYSGPCVVHQEVLCWEVIILEDTEVDGRVILNLPYMGLDSMDWIDLAEESDK
jgi:hypothetical protein